MSVTAVPIPPAAKGTLVKLWGGVALAVVAAGALAVVGTPSTCGSAFGKGIKPISTKSGLRYQVVKAGKGVSPTDTDVVLVNYKGALTSGKEFDRGERTPFPVQGLVPGFSEGLKIMQRGGSYKLCIPSALGYGAQANERIPANSTLVFEVDLLDFKSVAEVQAMQAQMQRAQGGTAGAGAPPPGMPPAQ
jgi:FKBP-type peptidyl-prolyl cis-trans isomerase FkpA